MLALCYVKLPLDMHGDRRAIEEQASRQAQSNIEAQSTDKLIVRSVLLQLTLIEACLDMHKLNELQSRDRSSRTLIGSEIVKTELKGSL